MDADLSCSIPYSEYLPVLDSTTCCIIPTMEVSMHATLVSVIRANAHCPFYGKTTNRHLERGNAVITSGYFQANPQPHDLTEKITRVWLPCVFRMPGLLASHQTITRYSNTAYSLSSIDLPSFFSIFFFSLHRSRRVLANIRKAYSVSVHI